MKKKIFASMCFVAMVSILLVSVAVVCVVFEQTRKSLEKQTVTESNYIEVGIEQVGLDYLDLVGEKVESRITLIESDGTVVYDNEADISIMENHSDRPEVQGAIENGSSEITRISDTVEHETYYYAVLLDDGTVLRVAHTMDSVYSSFSYLIPWLVLIIICVFVILSLLANFQTKALVQPINKINFEKPRENDIYEEFNPLLLRLEEQNKQISKNIRELKLKRVEFTAITQNMHEGLIVINKKMEVLSVNESAIKILGYKGEFQINSSVYILNHSLEFSSLIESALDGHSKISILVIHGRQYEVITNPVENRGKVTGAVIVMLDVTERERREDMRREFTANVSHELKTPLTSISGYAEIMKNGLVRPEDTDKFAGKIYNEAQRLIALVADIIKLSRMDEGGDSFTRELIDLYEVGQRVKNHLEPVIEKADVKMIFTGQSTTINGIPHLIEEMIYNLCENAIKYNKTGGMVKLNIERRFDKSIITVEDTGIGIPTKDTERIFERFYRVDKSHSKETGGTGLGLSIVKHSVIIHGGEILVDSKEGIGTKMTIIL